MFWERFRSLCASQGKYPSAVGEELGYTRQAVSAWKKGKSPKLDTIQKIADYFGVPVSYFLDIKKDNPEVGLSAVDFAVRFNSLSAEDQQKVLDYLAYIESRLP